MKRNSDKTTGSASSSRTTSLEDLQSKVQANDDALAFLKAAETAFQDDTEKYCMFLDLLLQFHHKRSQVDEVIETVKELFQGHNDLICGFNTFLSKEQEISQVTIDEEKDSEIHRAMAFIDNVKERLQNEERYRTFLDIMVEFQRGNEEIALQVFNEVTVLLNGHQDLIEEFTTFFPDVHGHE
ncbi:hypothetical protein L6164_005895 [Bauhinia variegata]|uniref:Uncharacterized protein n=1 Tax=Bauhinia variegata TaxID=167791 RepID=A0ACB9PS11_BAUVA|nr:hypothetical protein L6164_005895 [Bauhinia variegata]